MTEVAEDHFPGVVGHWGAQAGTAAAFSIVSRVGTAAGSAGAVFLGLAAACCGGGLAVRRHHHASIVAAGAGLTLAILGTAAATISLIFLGEGGGGLIVTCISPTNCRY